MKIIVYTACALSLVALIIALSDLRSYDAPLASLLVAVLGILVTFLVAWQIYNTFVSRAEIHEIRHDFEDLAQKLKERLDKSEKALVDRQNEGLIYLRDISIRNVDAAASIIVLRENHGVGHTLDFIINNLDKAEECGAYLRHLFSEAADGCISDIHSTFIRDHDDTLLRQCVEIIPLHKLSQLFTLNIEKEGWDVGRIEQFRAKLSYIISLYPTPGVPSSDEEQSQTEHPKKDGQ